MSSKGMLNHVSLVDWGWQTPVSMAWWNGWRRGQL